MSCKTACERLLLLVFLLWLQQDSFQDTGFVVDAYPSGAGSCKSDDDATRGNFLGLSPHNIPILTSRGELSKFGARVFINNTEVTTAAPFKLLKNKSYSLIVNTTRPFKGVLLRLEDGLKQDLVGALISSQPQVLQPHGLCIPPVVGLTHLNSKKKSEVRATIDTDGLQPSTLTLDVTIVLNIGIIPKWGHTGFTLDLD